MSLFIEKILHPIIRYKLKKETDKWLDEVEDWKLSDWRNFQAERFEELKKSDNFRFIESYFPYLKELGYEELVDVGSVDYYPCPPPEFPYKTYVSTTGTVRKKFVLYTRDDLIWVARGVRRVLRLAFRELPSDRFFMMHSGRPYASWAYSHIVKNFIKYYVEVEIRELSDIDIAISKAKIFGPFNVIGGAQAYQTRFLESLDKKDSRAIFGEPVTIITGADILYPTVLDEFKGFLNKFGVEEGYICDFYGASEVPVIGVTPEEYYTRDRYDLLFMPDVSIQVLEMKNGKRKNLLDAEKGDEGVLLSTPLFQFMIPNYRLKDIVRVVGRDPKTGLPTLKVLGREMYKVVFRHKSIGRVEGYTGVMFKIGRGAPLNVYDFDAFMRVFKTRYLLVVDKGDKKDLFRLYVEKPIKLEEFVEAMEKNKIVKPLYQAYIAGRLEIEIVRVDLKHLDVDFGDRIVGQPKIPKVIVRGL